MRLPFTHLAVLAEPGHILAAFFVVPCADFFLGGETRWGAVATDDPSRVSEGIVADGGEERGGAVAKADDKVGE